MASARRARPLHLALALLFLLGESIRPQSAWAAPAADPVAMPRFSDFRASVMTGNRKVVTGVYVDGLFALPVVQQAWSMWVSKQSNTVTQFAWTEKYGVTGLIAHDYLSGEDFYGLAPGQRVELIYGDGKVEVFWVTEVNRYRQSQPGSTATGYIDLATGRGYDVEGMFRKVYMGTRHVTFQTCIAKDGNLSWGTLFAIAEPRAYPARRPLREALPR